MTARARTPGAPDLNTGIALVLLTACMFSGSDATIKFLGGAMPVLVLMWVRYMFQTAVLAGWRLARTGSLRLRTRLPALEAGRYVRPDDTDTTTPRGLGPAARRVLADYRLVQYDLTVGHRWSEPGLFRDLS